MDKVKLPRNIAIDIERFRDIGCENVDILYTFASGKDKDNQSFADYAADNFDNLLAALVNGYEVEETPEDKVKNRYEKYSRYEKEYRESEQTNLQQYWEGSCDGIKDALDDLGIKIVGVNHE